MRAAVYYGPNKVEIADVPEPTPGAGEVKVKVGFNGICGTDLHEYYAGPIFIPTEPHPLTHQQLPLVLGHEFYDGFSWYFVLLAALAATAFVCASLVRSRTGRAWAMVRTNETVAAAIGIDVKRAKLFAFVVSSALTAFAGGLFAYYRGFVSIEAFSLYLAVQYVAMIIIGGVGSLTGAILGAAFVTVLPYVIEALLFALPGANQYAGAAFAANYAAFGLVMILFLALEPHGLMGLWRRLRVSARGVGMRP